MISIELLTFCDGKSAENFKSFTLGKPVSRIPVLAGRKDWDPYNTHHNELLNNRK